MAKTTDDPRGWPVVRAPDGTRFLTLPSGIVQRYEEDALAGMVIQALDDVKAGRPVPEVYLVTLRHLAGESDWEVAIKASAMEPEIVQALSLEMGYQ